MTTHTKVRELLASGASNKVIARATGRAVGTVKIHVSRILAETGSRNRTQAAVALNKARA